jgi:hypothetical protein
MATDKSILAFSALSEALNAHEANVGEFLEPATQQDNVVGMGVGVKWKNGQPTGEPALIVLVAQKLDKSALSKKQMIPSKLGNVQTDVLAIGYPVAGLGGVEAAMEPQTLAKRARPAEGGYSVGHYKITAGTIATSVYDWQPGATTTPPAAGQGIPSRYYILSNNHVLANSNNAAIGDPILQPGPYDGGNPATDQIARLSRFIPIQFAPPIPLVNHKNLVDAAVAEGQFHDLDREVYWNGYLRGWRPKSAINVGLRVKKSGRTTNFTTGAIKVVGATVDVNYGPAGMARFSDQFITGNMSAGGDSGSLVMTLDNVAVGLLFAGSSVAMIMNPIEHVRNLLRVEVAEQVL